MFEGLVRPLVAVQLREPSLDASWNQIGAVTDLGASLAAILDADGAIDDRGYHRARRAFSSTYTVTT